MRLVIADTSPVHYLILIGHIDLLPRLFERVVLPTVVLAELSHLLAPASVRHWIAAAPAWLEVAEAPAVALAAGIHKGEAAAIALASALHAELVLRFQASDRRAQTNDIPDAACFAGRTARKKAVTNKNDLRTESV